MYQYFSFLIAQNIIIYIKKVKSLFRKDIEKMEEGGGGGGLYNEISYSIFILEIS